MHATSVTAPDQVLTLEVSRVASRDGQPSMKPSRAGSQKLIPRDAPRSDTDPEAQSFLEATINMAESLTGIDLDGDGDVGMAGSDNAPHKMSNLYEVLVAASQQERRKFFNAGRRLIELEEMVENSWWLSPGMLKMKVDQRDGPTSASAKLAAFLQGRW